MGKISKGILGPVSGKVGTVIGGTWNGISYIRSMPSKGNRKFSQPQLEQQAKFALVGKFLQPFAGLFQQSFANASANMSAFNAAFGNTIQNAVTGSYPAYSFDYSKVLMSKGKLVNAISPSAKSTVAGKVDFTWSDNSGTSKALGTDNAIVVVYCPDHSAAVFSTNAATRSQGAASILASAFSGLEVETYIGFISADGKLIANSVYTGKLTLA
jgi:hypothetical protein